MPVPLLKIYTFYETKKKDHAKVYLGYCKVSEVAVIDALSLGAAKTWLTTQENTQLQFQQIGKSR
jgi:hypothetical protein